jgi:hypothetical protein
MHLPQEPEDQIKFLQGAVTYLAAFCGVVAAHDPGLLAQTDKQFQAHAALPLGPVASDAGQEGALYAREIITRRIYPDRE